MNWQEYLSSETASIYNLLYDCYVGRKDIREYYGSVIGRCLAMRTCCGINCPNSNVSEIVDRHTREYIDGACFLLGNQTAEMYQDK